MFIATNAAVRDEYSIDDCCIKLLFLYI